MSSNVNIRIANQNDVEDILALIKELAIFEQAESSVINTKEQLLIDGFSNNPVFTCFVAQHDNKIIGIALCYVRYSTWQGKCLFLEDLIVTSSYRGKGIGSMLFNACLDYSKSIGYYKMQWQVLDWNVKAIDFYEKLGALTDKEWWNMSIKTVE